MLHENIRKFIQCCTNLYGLVKRSNLNNLLKYVIHRNILFQYSDQNNFSNLLTSQIFATVFLNVYICFYRNFPLNNCQKSKYSFIFYNIVMRICYTENIVFNGMYIPTKIRFMYFFVSIPGYINNIWLLLDTLTIRKVIISWNII